MTSTEYMYYRLNEDGTTTGMENLDRWPSNEERRVDRTDLPDGVWVSTVFLVLDHGYGGDPLLFETMIFGGDHDQYCDRYATLAEARAGHERVVAALREGRDPERAS